MDKTKVVQDVPDLGERAAFEAAAPNTAYWTELSIARDFGSGAYPMSERLGCIADGKPPYRARTIPGCCGSACLGCGG